MTKEEALQEYQEHLEEISANLKRVQKGTAKHGKKSPIKPAQQYAWLARELVDAAYGYIQDLSEEPEEKDVNKKFRTLYSKIFSELFGERVMARDSDRRIAYLVQGLMLCKSGSQKQTVKVVSEWMGSYVGSMIVTAVSMSDFREALKASGISSSDKKETVNKTITRAIKTLTEAEIIVSHKDFVWIAGQKDK